MTLYNLSSTHYKGFKRYRFSAISDPLLPKSFQNHTELEIAGIIWNAIPEYLRLHQNWENRHFIVNGKPNVVHYALSLIHHRNGTAYYVKNNNLIKYIKAPLEWHSHIIKNHN